MSKFTEFLASLVNKPTTLTAAHTIVDGAKAQLDSVSALFSAAGLNLETMLSAGPDALKAHLASLGAADAALATATARINELTAAASAATTAHAIALAAASTEFHALNTKLTASHSVLTALGLDPKAAIDEPAAKKAFTAHVQKAANLELAKSGHPPIREVPADALKPDALKGPDGKELTGLARTQAIFAAKLKR